MSHELPKTYYEFFNLPDAPGWPKAPKQKTGESARKSAPNPYSESAVAGDVYITYSMDATTDPDGWTNRGPHDMTVTISRKVRSHKNQAGEASPNIVKSGTGDLMLYRVALLSTMPGWNCNESAKAEWPKAHVAMVTSAGPIIKLDLERLLVDSWELEVGDRDASNIYETLRLRASVFTQSLAKGNPLKFVLDGN